MIRGIGVDTVDIARFGRQLDRTPALRARLFAEAERGLSTDSLAARFAAKEALIKALGGSGELRWHDMVVLRGPDRVPHFEVTPGLQRELAARGATHPHVSMTHDGGTATAFVVVERDPHAETSDDTRPPRETHDAEAARTPGGGAEAPTTQGSELSS